jgi:hypothetical protein
MVAFTTPRGRQPCDRVIARGARCPLVEAEASAVDADREYRVRGRALDLPGGGQDVVDAQPVDLPIATSR